MRIKISLCYWILLSGELAIISESYQMTKKKKQRNNA